MDETEDEDHRGQIMQLEKTVVLVTMSDCVDSFTVLLDCNQFQFVTQKEHAFVQLRSKARW